MGNIVDKRKYINVKLKQIANTVNTNISNDELNSLKQLDSSFNKIIYINDNSPINGKYYKQLINWGTHLGGPSDLNDSSNSLSTLLSCGFELINLPYKSKWNRYMEGSNGPTIMREAASSGQFARFARFKCIKSNDTYITDGIRFTPNYAVSKGIFECEARFHLGATAWPAIWCTSTTSGQLLSDNRKKYCEIDLVEYFYSAKRGIDTTYHDTDSFNDSSKYHAATTNTSKYMDDWNGQNNASHNDKWIRFTCEWDETYIKCYTNGILSLTINNENDSDHFPQSDEDRKLKWIISMQYNYHGGDMEGDDNNINQYPNKELPNDDDFQNDNYLWMDIKNIKLYEQI